MSYTSMSNYLLGLFAGLLGLFNSTKMELRQITDSNIELIFQNGQIISATVIFVCISGFAGDWVNMMRGPYKLQRVRKIHKLKLVDGANEKKDEEE